MRRKGRKSLYSGGNDTEELQNEINEFFAEAEVPTNPSFDIPVKTLFPLAVNDILLAVEFANKHQM